MRTKEEILKDTREDITDKTYSTHASLWVQYRLIEVLIDIRDILKARTEQIADAQATILDNL